MSVMTDLPAKLDDQMKKAISAMTTDFAAIRTGKASGAIVENIMVDYYGTQTRMRDLAGISTPDARTICIQPWDKGAMSAIEKAIINSDVGISPVNDGKVIRLPVPPLSAERRTQLSKQVKSRAEEGKVSIRNVRRDGNEIAKKAQKGGEITEDDLKNLLDKIQKMTDGAIKDIDTLAADKEKELMTV